MERKYVQREETRYANNEFESMPSIDYRVANPPYLTTSSKDRIDWSKVKEICDNHGFKYCTINNTFGSDTIEFVLYLKTDIDSDYYTGLKGHTYELNMSHADSFRKLHKCIHELDENTDLMFECGWGGNCGVFGSDDIHRMIYLFASHLTSWRMIVNEWSPLIHDTKRKLSKGVYVMVNTHYIKPEIQNSPSLENYEGTLLDIVRGFLSTEYTAKFEHGKRQCDTDTDGYMALVVRTAKTNRYCGMVTFNRDWMGQYHITSASPLTGQSSWVMDWKTPLDDLKEAILYFAN